MDTTVKNIIETTLKVEIVKAFNSVPEAIEKLVEAALGQEVGEEGGPSKYGGTKMPFLDWLVGDQIRRAAALAVREVVKEREGEIREAVRAKLSTSDIIDEFTKHVLKTASDDWRISVKFESDK
jgi:hypothetical protein